MLKCSNEFMSCTPIHAKMAEKCDQQAPSVLGIGANAEDRGRPLAPKWLLVSSWCAPCLLLVCVAFVRAPSRHLLTCKGKADNGFYCLRRLVLGAFRCVRLSPCAFRCLLRFVSFVSLSLALSSLLLVLVVVVVVFVFALCVCFCSSSSLSLPSVSFRAQIARNCCAIILKMD